MDSGHPIDSGQQAAPTTTFEQVQRWAPPGTKVVGVGVEIPGIELFGLDDGRPVPMDAYKTYPVVAVVGGLGKPILQGPDVMKAVIAATRDPKLLASATMVVNRRVGQILDSAGDDLQRKRGVTAPALSATALDFWVLSGSPYRNLYHAHLDLGTLAFTFQEPAVPDSEQLANALAVLATATAGRTQTYDLAIDLAVKQCSDPAARKALFEALATGKQEEFRMRVATALKGCGPVAIDPLIATLEKDPSSNVKGTAADVLGQLGDPRAKPALEKAAQSSDSTVSYMAKDALKKLKK